MAHFMQKGQNGPFQNTLMFLDVICQKVYTFSMVFDPPEDPIFTLLGGGSGQGSRPQIQGFSLNPPLHRVGSRVTTMLLAYTT